MPGRENINRISFPDLVWGFYPVTSGTVITVAALRAESTD